MLRPFLPLRGIAALALAALVLGGLGGMARGDQLRSSLLLFAAWMAAVLLLFALALRLPLRIGGPRYRAALWNLMLAGIAVVLTYLANVAVFRHDAPARFLDEVHGLVKVLRRGQRIAHAVHMLLPPTVTMPATPYSPHSAA